MPYSLIWEPLGVYKKFTGHVTGVELVRSVNEVANGLRFAQAHYEVSDYLDAQATDFSQDALNEVRAVRIGSFSRNPKIRVAIVTWDAAMQKRIFSTLAAQLTLQQIKIFSAVADANTWLGREVTALA